MRRFESNREASGDSASKDSLFESGTSRDLRNPFVDKTGQAGHVDPKSQSDSMQMALNKAYQVGSKLYAEFTGKVGDPDDYQPAKIAEHGLSQDDIEQLKLEKAKNQGATASTSRDANHGASSDSEELYSDDDDWTVVKEEIAFGWPSRPKNLGKEVQSNDPVAYRKELLCEGYRPKPSQGFLEGLWRSFSPNWRDVNSTIEVLNSEQNSERYRNQLNEAIVKDAEFARSVAKEFFREGIEGAKYKLYEEIDKEESMKLIELKIKMNDHISRVQSEQSLQEIRNQENKLKEIKEKKEEKKLILKEIRKQREEDMKEHQDKKNKILQNIKKCENKLSELKGQKTGLKTDMDKLSNDQEIEQKEKELNSLKEQKAKELEVIEKNKKELRRIEYLEDNLQKIRQCEEELRKLKEKRSEFAKEIRERLSQNQEYAANRFLKDLDAISKKYGKSSSQWVRFSFLRLSGFRTH
jgi:hypothetical protein